MKGSAEQEIRIAFPFLAATLALMRINVLATLAFLSLFIGCSTTPQEQGAEKPPKHARRVHVVIYDSTSRPKTSHLDIYDGRPGLPVLAGGSRLPERPYKEIALLTCEGAPKEEAEMTTAILYRARMLGADAIMTVDTTVTQDRGIFIPTSRGVFGGGVDTRCVFRAKAIVYEDKK